MRFHPRFQCPRFQSVGGALTLCGAVSLGLLNSAPALGEVLAATGHQGDPATETVALVVGRSQNLAVPWPVKGASLTDPAVADVQVLTPELVLVSGKAPGVTDVIVWNEAGATHSTRVEVNYDLGRLQSELATLFPGAGVRIERSGQATIVLGSFARAEQAQQLHKYLEAQQLAYVDMTRLAGVQQVQVKVRVAEVSRQGIRALGVNGFRTGDDFFIGNTIGSSSGGPLNPVSIGPDAGAAAGSNIPFVFNRTTQVSPAVTMFAGFPGSDLELFFQALAENQYLRILAEPNLVALSGEDASFLAGGEFPIPIVQGGGGGTGGAAITIEYKQFGVGLKFRPTVLGDNAIRLKVASEVSDISDVGALTIQGFRIPAIVTRRADTTLEMHSGQTFAMAGLLNESAKAQASRIPGLGDLPVLGPLFRSVRYERGETELLLIVTAALVEPMSDTTLPPLPGTTHVAPSDWELYSEGRIEGRAPARLSPSDSEWLKAKGLDRLKGPGAWATHGDPPAPITSQPTAIHEQATPEQQHVVAAGE